MIAAEARAFLSWEQSAQIALTIASVYRGKGSKQLTMADFNPLRKKKQKAVPAGIEALKLLLPG